MAVTSIVRVRKYRARKASTPEGLQEIKSKNNLYKARSRRKTKIKRLSREKANLTAALPPAQQIYVDNKSLLFRAGLLQSKGEGDALGRDEQQEVDIEVLTHEIDMAKMLREKERAGGRGHLPHLPFLDDDLIEDDELMDALSTSFGTAAEPTELPLKDMFEADDGADVDKLDDELFHREVSAMFGDVPDEVPSSMEELADDVPSSMEALAEGPREARTREVSDEDMLCALSNSLDQYL